MTNDNRPADWFFRLRAKLTEDRKQRNHQVASSYRLLQRPTPPPVLPPPPNPAANTRGNPNPQYPQYSPHQQHVVPPPPVQWAPAVPFPPAPPLPNNVISMTEWKARHAITTK